MATQGPRCECSWASIMRLYVFFSRSFFFKILIYLTIPALSCGMGDLVSWPGIEPSTESVEC